MLIDNTGFLIYSYEVSSRILMGGKSGLRYVITKGRPVSSLKLPGLRPNVISSKCVSLSNDTLAVQDQKDEKSIL